MKKIICLLLSFLFALTILTGCKDKELGTGNDPIPEYDSEQKIPTPKPEDKPETSVNTENTSEVVNITGEFTVKHKKYAYEGNDLIVLNFENGTNTHYTVTIEGNYKDENGNILFTEEQTYNDIAAGTSAYFLFKPDMQFDTFEYEVYSEVYEGTLWRSNFIPKDYNSELPIQLQYWYGPFVDKTDGKAYETHQLCSKLEFENKNEVNTYCEFAVIIFDSNDQIFVLEERKYDWQKNCLEADWWCQDFWLYAGHEEVVNLDKDTWPDYLKNGFYGIAAVQAVLTKEEVPEDYWALEDRRENSRG